MHRLNHVDAPEGHLWAKDLASTSQCDIATIIWLCEKEYIQGVKINGQWAIRVLKITSSTKMGNAVVRDLKAGRDIAIGSVIGQYITVNGGQSEDDYQKQIAQEPIRYQIETTQRLVHITWYVIGGGSLFFLVGLIFAIPISALLATIAVFFGNKAVRLAGRHGDTVLIKEAKKIQSLSIILAIILWGILVSIVGFFILISSA